jgi:type II secretory ATPase GspE/PulE/Tfp pilus assembly ATPase PilB-like protein
VASSLIGSIAQRLVRVICPRCKTPVTASPVELGQLGITPEMLNGGSVYEGAGCPECRGVGFRGRSGLFEMLTVDDTVRQMIVNRAPSTEIRQYAQRTQGMRTLIQDGRRRILTGETTVKEVLRVCQREELD